MSFKLRGISYVESSQDQREKRKKKSGYLERFHKCLSNQFYSLGYYIATSPSYFIVIPIFLSLFFITGFQSMEYEKDPEYLFSPSNAKGRVEREVVERLFPINYSLSFDPSRITNISPFARLLVTSKENDTLLRTKIWDDIMLLDSLILNLTIQWQEKEYGYEDVCAIWNSKCLENQILNLNEIMPEVENGTKYIDYPIMLFPPVFPFYYGGAKVNETEGYLESVKAIALHYWLKQDNWMQKERSILFENKVLELLSSKEFENINVSPFVSMSLEDELEDNTSSILGYLPPTVLIMIIFSLISIMSFDWVRSKIQISVLGIVTAGLATACSFGLLMYCKIPFIGINLAAPFLLLGIGIDDMFVVLSAWHRTNIQDDVPIRLAHTYSEAAVSITITSLTNMLSFFIGAITPFPSVYIFCIYTGVSVLITYCFFITFFGACLALAGYQEKRQRHSLSCKPVLSKSESGEAGWFYYLFCAGGVNEDDPWNTIDNKPHALMTFFKDYFSQALNNPAMKGFIIGFFLMYLAGAIYGCLQITEGLEKRKLALDDSYLTNYYEIEDSLFRKYPYRIQIIINENVTYSDPVTKKQLLDLHLSFENLTCIGPRVFTQSWIRGFYRFLRARPSLRKKVTDEKSFIAVLKEEYLIPETPEYLDIVFNEDETQIIASRFIIQSYEINDTNADKDMMLDIRKVAEDAPFKVVTYYPLFVFFDQFVLVAPLTMQTISLVAVVMMIISFIFIPNPFCSLWVIFSIISIEVGVIGYMALWGVSLDCISMINLIMCIGFSVDFSAHISYSYLTAKVETPKERVKECMFNLGLPVLQSGLSTIAGVFVFIVAPSNIFRTFFKIILLVIVFGTMHAILLLPVMLSLVGPGSCQRKKPLSLKKTLESISQTVPKCENPLSLENLSANTATKELESHSLGSTCSESIQYTQDSSDNDSTKTSTGDQNSYGFEGTSNSGYVEDEGVEKVEEQSKEIQNTEEEQNDMTHF